MNLYKRGQTWWCKFRIDNKLYQYSCKTRNKNEAQEIAAALHGDAVRDKFNIPKRFKVKRNLKECWEEYLKSLINAKTTLARKKVASGHFLKAFGSILIEEITPAKIKEYQLTRRLEIIESKKNLEPDISFRSINLELSTLSHLFNFCMEKAYIDINPVAGIKKLYQGKRNIYLSQEEQGRLISAASPHLRPFLAFSMLTGLRKSDALGLKWNDVDLKEMIYKVWINKTKKWEIYPLSRAAGSVLNDIKKESEYVFSYRGKKIGDIKRAFNTAVKRAELSGKTGLTPHALRHIFVTRLTEKGVKSKFIRDAAGHMTEEMSERYKHLSPDALRAELDKAFD